MESAKPSVPTDAVDSNGKDASTATSLEEGEASSPKVDDNDRRTLIERTFGGKLVTGIRCTHCDCVSEKEEPFTDLSLAFCPSRDASESGESKASWPL